MNNITENKGLIKLLGFLAVGGIAIGVLADFFTGWSNLNTMDTALSLSFENIKGLFITKPRWTYVLGHYLAIFFLPFHIVGSYLVYLALKPAGKKIAMSCFFLAVYVSVLGTGYHGTFAFVGDIIQSGNKDLMDKMLDYWAYWGIILAIGYLILTLLLLILIFLGKSIFPKWIVILSPVSIMVFTTIVALLLPDNMIGVKSFLTMTGLNFPLLIFYFVTTKYLLLEKNVDMRFP